MKRSQLLLTAVLAIPVGLFARFINFIRAKIGFLVPAGQNRIVTGSNSCSGYE